MLVTVALPVGCTFLATLSKTKHNPSFPLQYKKFDGDKARNEP